MFSKQVQKYVLQLKMKTHVSITQVQKPPNPENSYFKLSDQDPVTTRREIELKTGQLSNSTQPNSKFSNMNFQIWKIFNIN